MTNPFQYIGRKGYYADSDGAYYVRARIYNPVTGRFFSRDPISFDSGEINLYRYAKGCPVNEVDPSGLVVLIAVPIVIGGVVVVFYYCTCALARTGVLDMYAAGVGSPAQLNCIDNASALLGKVTGENQKYSECARNMFVGTGLGPGNLGTTVRPRVCKPTPILDAAATTCNSCQSYVTLLATVAHECIHQGQGYDVYEDPAECEAYARTFGLLTHIEDALCKSLVASRSCSSIGSCKSEVQKQKDNELAKFRALFAAGKC